jgi:hypothetical protein
MLREFLDSSEEHRWLSVDERHLLVESQVEGVPPVELARRNGHSQVAAQHRGEQPARGLRLFALDAMVLKRLELFPPRAREYQPKNILLLRGPFSFSLAD